MSGFHLSLTRFGGRCPRRAGKSPPARTPASLPPSPAGRSRLQAAPSPRGPPPLRGDIPVLSAASRRAARHAVPGDPGRCVSGEDARGCGAQSRAAERVAVPPLPPRARAAPSRRVRPSVRGRAVPATREAASAPRLARPRPGPRCARGSPFPPKRFCSLSSHALPEGPLVRGRAATRRPGGRPRPEPRAREAASGGRRQRRAPGCGGRTHRGPGGAARARGCSVLRARGRSHDPRAGPACVSAARGWPGGGGSPRGKRARPRHGQRRPPSAGRPRGGGAGVGGSQTFRGRRGTRSVFTVGLVSKSKLLKRRSHPGTHGRPRAQALC